jgi:predicted glycoside hydrolase/deacetylase ChbG (UPF0249 family)
MPGLLIVNADDLGGNRLATDRILGCFEAGSITSATAMVFMADSVRAARLARPSGLPVGLHLNLTQAFNAPDVPASVARRQARVVRFMAGARRRRFGFAPHLLDAVREAISDQLDRFRDLYGADPTHVDGHNHIHLNPTVLVSLPGGWAVRPAADAGGPQRRVLVPRRIRDWTLARRHPTVEYFFAITSVHPALGGAGLERALGLAAHGSVELMVHPDRDATFEVIGSDDWRGRLAGRRLGSYADLRPGAGLGCRG